TIGRLAELAGLRSALETAATGSGEMVCIVGESGIGKTTLVEEFLEELSRPPGLCFVGSGRCSERLADAEAYLPVLEVLDSLLRGPSGNLAAHCLRGQAPGWYAELFPHAREVPSGVLDEARGEPSPPRLKREFLSFLKDLARQGVVVVFIDDIQWADLPTADLLAYLGRHLPAMRLLVVVTYRRDEMVQGHHPFLAAQRDLQARGVCRELAPELLGHADIDRYLELTFPAHDFPTEFSKSIHAKTGGNPLFVADLVRYLRDRGIIAHSGDRWRLVREVPDAAGEMPASIRGLILRKLDRLEPRDRRILAGAAVQGTEFDSAVVARAVTEGQADVEDRLQELDHTHGLVRRLRENEFPDRTLSRRYRFVHAIYQESLVSELSPARRGAISNALADASLALQNGQAGLAAAELACLYESGRNLGLAAELFHTAAENAARLSAHREALRLACRGLGLLRGLPDTSQNAAREFHLQMTIGLQLQLTHGYAAPGVDEAYGRAREIWERSPAVGKLFPILWGLWLFHKVRSDLGRANLLAGELLALAEQLGDAALALQAHQAGAVVALCAGEPTATRRHMEAALRLYDPGRHAPLTFTFGQDPGVACQAFGAVALWLLGHPEEARSRSEEAVRIARAGSQPSSLALALHFAGVLHQFADNPAVVRESASEALAVAVEHQFAFWQAGATILLGWAAAATDSPDGIELLKEGIEAWRMTESETYRAYYLGLLADASFRCGRREEAIAALDEAEKVGRANGERLFEPEFHRLRGELASTRSDAEGAFRKAIETSRAQSARGLELRAAIRLCRLLDEEGREDEARTIMTAFGQPT
ncbi:MAG TPA: AAA family ATPase, partial [Gemmata sp.]|nr:AAA family ATPase [Gemmata sp.]